MRRLIEGDCVVHYSPYLIHLQHAVTKGTGFALARAVHAADAEVAEAGRCEPSLDRH